MSNYSIGIKQDSFITIVDESDEDILTNVIVNIQEAYVYPTRRLTPLLTLYFSKQTTEDVPVKGLSDDTISKIPRRPKKAPEPETNGTSNTSSKRAADLDIPINNMKRARIDDDGEAPQPKKLKVASGPTDGDEVICLDADQDSGAIVIDD